MELLVTLSSFDNLKKFTKKETDGLIFGGPFSLRFKYNLEQMRLINDYCLNNGLKRYVTLDTFVFENDKVAIYEYLDFLSKLDVDGIYFTDLGIVLMAEDFKHKLTYDPDTLLTNSLDVSFYRKQSIGCVLSRELTIDEITRIVNNNVGMVDLQVFGRLKMSYSRRKFLSNYFKHVDSEIDLTDKKDVLLIEESRDYALPIIEDKYGTRIYTDYIFLMYQELLPLKDKIRRAIVDDSLINDCNLICDVLRDFKRLSADNYGFLYRNLVTKYPNYNFSSGYLYQKTSNIKEDSDEKN